MKFIILGAGPAGLSFAHRLLQRGCDDFLVLEAQAEAGGLCRSEIVDGSPMDVGGGHFLDAKRPHVTEFLFQFMPIEEWNSFERNSQIDVHGSTIQHPIEANLWQLEIDQQVEYLQSIANAGCNSGVPMPTAFTSWIEWKLGKKISDNYMLPYNAKMFGKRLNELGTYWLDKLPDVSFEQTLRSCLEKKAHGTQPGHAKFFYPKEHGYGEVWRRMSVALDSKIIYGCKVDGIDFSKPTVSTSGGESFTAENVVTTVPWRLLTNSKHLYKGAKDDFHKLHNNSIRTEYFRENLDSNAHWIYYPDEKKPFHRKLLRQNFLPGSRGFWTETNEERASYSGQSPFAFRNEFAYPLNTIGKPELVSKILRFSQKCGVFGLGRWGEHQHYNSDVTVEKALNLADLLH